MNLLPAAYQLPEPIRPCAFAWTASPFTHQPCPECNSVGFLYPDPPDAFTDKTLLQHPLYAPLYWDFFCDVTWRVLGVVEVTE